MLYGRFALSVMVPSLLLWTIGCGPREDQDREGGPVGAMLIPVDSVLLPEVDTAYVGRPRGIVVDPEDGSFYITDLFSSRVLRFARNGSLMRVYGGPGEGPGEFRTAGATFLLDDSTLVVHDTRLQRLSIFDRRTGASRTSRHLPLLVGTSPAVVDESGVWLPVADPGLSSSSSIAHWILLSDSIAYIGSMPAEFRESIDGGNWIYANSLLQGVLAALGDTLVRGWMSRNELVLFSREGQVLDTVDLPVLRRRGVPEDIRYRFDVENIGFEERLELNSALIQLRATSDGRLMFTHHDRQVIDLLPMPVMTADVWVGVVSSDLTRACVDARLPVSTDTRSMETFRGDTVFQLDRRIVDNRLESWVRMFLVDTSDCDWVPTADPAGE